MGLTDIEMAQGLEYDDPYFDDRVFEMEYEVSKNSHDFQNYIFSHISNPKFAFLDVVECISTHNLILVWH